MNTIFLRKLAVVLVAVFFASCDKDYNTLGSEIVGNGNFTAKPELFLVKAYNQKLPQVQTNNLPINQLGVMYNNILGTTKANFVTQLSLATVKPVFKSNIAIDSVVLTVPYYSTQTFVDANGIGTYNLNSINTTDLSLNSASIPKTYDPIDIKVFRNGVYMRDSDPFTLGAQKHFSDEDSNFNSNKIGTLLNNRVYNSLTPEIRNENTAFVPDTREYKKYKVVNNVITADVESHNSPRIRLHLDTNYFKTNIIQASAVNLDNNNAFKSYFQGLYFQVDQLTSTTGTSMSLDFSKGDVTIYYKQDVVDGVPGTQEMASLTLNMTGNTANLLTNTDNPAYTNAVSTLSTNADLAGNGAKNLYLKGGQGSMGFIELFSEAGKLAELKAKGVLVNDASLTFTVNQTNMTNYIHPQRIYIYDADNNTPLYDYYFDNSTNPADTKLNKYVHGGIIISDATSNTITYKVKITEHINNILKETTGTTKNVRLGIVVTENINLISYGTFFSNPLSSIPAYSTSNSSKTMDKIPVSSIMNPLGTVLYGSNYIATDGDYDKRIKFEIYYTKPN